MEVVTKIAPIALALIMLILGLGLTTSDFTRVIKRPKDFLVGLICQVIFLPIIAFVLIKILNVFQKSEKKKSVFKKTNNQLQHNNINPELYNLNSNLNSEIDF